MPEWLGPRQKQSLVVLILFVAGIWYMNTRKAATPEQIVRKIVEKMTQAAEEKQMDVFRETISESFKDNHGNHKKDALDLLRGIFFTQEAIHVTIVSLDVQQTSQANLVSAHLNVFFSESILPTDKGEYQLLFRNEEGSWRLVEAQYLNIVQE